MERRRHAGGVPGRSGPGRAARRRVPPGRRAARGRRRVGRRRHVGRRGSDRADSLGPPAERPGEPAAEHDGDGREPRRRAGRGHVPLPDLVHRRRRQDQLALAGVLGGHRRRQQRRRPHQPARGAGGHGGPDHLAHEGGRRDLPQAAGGAPRSGGDRTPVADRRPCRGRGPAPRRHPQQRLRASERRRHHRLVLRCPGRPRVVPGGWPARPRTDVHLPHRLPGRCRLRRPGPDDRGHPGDGAGGPELRPARERPERARRHDPQGDLPHDREPHQDQRRHRLLLHGGRPRQRRRQHQRLRRLGRHDLRQLRVDREAGRLRDRHGAALRLPRHGVRRGRQHPPEQRRRHRPPRGPERCALGAVLAGPQREPGAGRAVQPRLRPAQRHLHHGRPGRGLAAAARRRFDR